MVIEFSSLLKDFANIL